MPAFLCRYCIAKAFNGPYEVMHICACVLSDTYVFKKSIKSTEHLFCIPNLIRFNFQNVYEKMHRTFYISNIFLILICTALSLWLFLLVLAIYKFAIKKALYYFFGLLINDSEFMMFGNAMPYIHMHSIPVPSTQIQRATQFKCVSFKT